MQVDGEGLELLAHSNEFQLEEKLEGDESSESEVELSIIIELLPSSSGDSQLRRDPSSDLFTVKSTGSIWMGGHSAYQDTRRIKV